MCYICLEPCIMHYCRTQCAVQGKLVNGSPKGECKQNSSRSRMPSFRRLGPTTFASCCVGNPYPSNSGENSRLLCASGAPAAQTWPGLLLIALHTAQSSLGWLWAAEDGRRPLSCKVTVLMLAVLSMQTSHVLAFPGVRAAEWNTTGRASINPTVRPPEIPVATLPLHLTLAVPPPPVRWHLGKNESLAIDVMTPVMTVREFLTAQYYVRGRATYVEWGSGASTLLLAPLARVAVSIENKQNWCAKMKSRVDIQFWQRNGGLTYKCVDTGPTG